VSNHIESWNLVREGGYPTVTSHTGEWVIDPSAHSLIWAVPRVSANDETKTGTLEFSVGGDDASAFFPVKVNFTGLGSLIGIDVRYYASFSICFD
jgi:hypothetical protein